LSHGLQKNDKVRLMQLSGSNMQESIALQTEKHIGVSAYLSGWCCKKMITPDGSFWGRQTTQTRQSVIGITPRSAGRVIPFQYNNVSNIRAVLHNKLRDMVLAAAREAIVNLPRQHGAQGSHPEGTFPRRV
jgi:hypothetical protein